MLAGGWALTTTMTVVVVVDFSWRPWTRGSGTDGGGMVADAEGYVRQPAAVAGSGRGRQGRAAKAAAAGGGGFFILLIILR